MKIHQTPHHIKIDPFGNMTSFVVGNRYSNARGRGGAPTFSLTAMDNISSEGLDLVISAIKQAQEAMSSADNPTTVP